MGYDPEQNQWTLLPSMQQKRSDAGCTVVGDLICVAGGTDGSNRLSSVEAYNTTTGKWIGGIPRMSKERFLRSSCASLNGELYVLGDRTCEKYNFQTQNWTVVRECQQGTWKSCVFEEKILAMPVSGDPPRPEVYDAGQDTWTWCEDNMVNLIGYAVAVVSGRDLGREVLQQFQ